MDTSYIQQFQIQTISTSRNRLFYRSKKTTEKQEKLPIVHLQETLQIQLPLGRVQALKDGLETLPEFRGTLRSQ